MSEELVQPEINNEWKVRLQNFQSIVDGEISIGDGLTIVTGDTNSGKTAFFRAISSSIFNTGTDDLVKAGNKIAGVTISNGRHTMVYCRNAQGKNEKTAYQFDGGTVQKKVGRAQLPEVISMFGIRDVRMQNGIKMQLNFWNQGEKPFLTDRTAGQLYEFLSLSSCDKYVKVLKQMVTDIKVQEAEINNCNVKIDTLKVINNRKQEFIDKNKGFDEVYKKTIIASDKAKKFNENLSTLSDISVLKGDIDTTKNKLISTSEKLGKIDAKGVSDRYGALIQLNDFYSKLYDTLSEVKSIQDTIKDNKSKLKDVSDRYKALSKAEKDLGKKVKQLTSDDSKYSGLFDIAEECVRSKASIDDIKNRIISIDSNSIDIDGLTHNLTRLTQLDSELNNLNELIVKLKSLKSEMKGLVDSIEKVNKDIVNSDNELELLKEEVGYCPFCGSVFNECSH